MASNYSSAPIVLKLLVWANLVAIYTLKKILRLSHVAILLYQRQQTVKSSFTLMIAIYTKKLTIFHHFSVIRGKRIPNICTPTIFDMLFQYLLVLISFHEYLLPFGLI